MKIKMKNNKGITMISLIISVVLLMILAYASVSIGIGITADVKFQNIETYMLLIQSKCETLANDEILGEPGDPEDPDGNGLYGTLQESGNYEGWYKLSQAELNEIGVKDAKASDGYYVDYNLDNPEEEVDVAYEKGVLYDDTMYYLLSAIREITDE